MPKNLLQDMIKIKNIRQKREVKSEVHIKLKESKDGMEIAKEEVREVKIVNRQRPRYILWFVAVVSVVFLFLALSYFFAEATVAVNPKVKDVVLNENLSASKNGSTGTLPFDIVVISGDTTDTISVTGEKDASIKAQGIVMLYNSFSSAPQVLDINTKLEGSNGKIYKTQSRVVIPGMRVGKPGSAQVKIYADVAGIAYNNTPLDFKIFNFKGTPKYTKFYARSTGPITGGFVGKIPVITDVQKTSIIKNLKTSLQVKLLKKATDQIPAGFILFKDAVFLKTDEDSVDFTYVKDNALPVTLKGTLYGFLFDENKLTQKIAKNNIDNYDGSLVYIQNIRNLTFTLANKNNILFADVQDINFVLSGITKIAWRVDADKLKLDLLGKSKSGFTKTLLQYPAIDSANLTISPVWKFSIPDSSKKVTMIVNYP